MSRDVFVREANLDLSSKRIDRFIVSFYGLPENESNVLAQFIKEVDRPSFSVEFSLVPYKGVNHVQSHKTSQFDSLSMAFYDDNQSIVMDSLYRQMYRQLNRGEVFEDDPRNGQFEYSSFDINIKCYNSLGENVEEYNIKKALLEKISPVRNSLSGEEESTIEVTFTYEDLEYVFDR